MRAVDLIIKKRNGEALSEKDLEFFIRAVVEQEIPDYQAAAMLMAIYFQGMNARETGVLTRIMRDSGEKFDLSLLSGPKIDKHSTGGVGDKVSLPLAPLVACCGVVVPMVSGRALGHTGGTLDKLEAIPGFRTELQGGEFVSQLEAIGVAMMGQTEHFVPADKWLYALRDVTGTVESIPLIASSILSKKLAEGAQGLVFDVKTGNGAFMQEEAKARKLARALVELGHELGAKTVALLTDMNQPLGNAVGNSLEVIESIELLKGKGPKDLEELVLTLGAYMLQLGKVRGEIEEGKELLREKINSGEGLAKFREMIEAQGGEARVVEDYGVFPKAEKHEEVKASEGGYVASFATREAGIASMILGAGRESTEDVIDPSVGLVVEKKIGEAVEKGEVVFRVYYNEEERWERARELLEGSFTITEEMPEVPELIKAVIMGE